MLEEKYGCTLLDVAAITRCLEIQHEGDNRHGILAGGGTTLHLHGLLLGLLFQSVYEFIVVPGELFNKAIVSKIDRIGKQFVYCSDDCWTRNFLRLIDTVVLVTLVCFVPELSNVRRLRMPGVVLVAANA